MIQIDKSSTKIVQRSIKTALTKKKVWLIILPLFLISGVSFLTVQKFVTAQVAGQGMEISPPSQEVTVNPGETTTIKAKLRNPSNKTLPISVRVEDFLAKGEEGQVELTSSSPYSVISWTKISPEKFELAPGESQEVTATINVPADAAGGRFGSFVFAVQPDTPEGTAASVAQQVASLFLLKVSGPVDEKLAIKSFSAPGFSEFGPVPFEVNVANEGNVHVKTYGLINVTDMFGNRVADVVVKGTNVFPQAERNIKAQLDKQFLFGQYKASALLYFGEQNDNITANTTFIVFPVRIAVGILIVIIILFLMRKRFKRAGKALRK